MPILHVIIWQAIEKGDTEGISTVASWLESLPSGDEKKAMLNTINTIKYNNSSTALHLAAEYNQPEVAKLLLDKGAGNILINKIPKF